MNCEQCGKIIKEKLNAHCSDEDYLKLRMGDPSAIVFCQPECFNLYEMQRES